MVEPVLVIEREVRTRASWLRRTLARTLLTAWFCGLTVLSAGLLARHMIALPAPAPTSMLGLRLEHLASRVPTFAAVHVLAADCPCSQRVVQHLLSTDRPSGWHELVLWIGDPAPSPALVAKFDVRRLSASELAALGIEAAPILIAIDPDGNVLYSGGYTDRKQGPVFHDLDVLTTAHRPLAALPVFGCAISERLQHALANLPVP